ncbi:MAG: MBL fold metallo-hydrolase [Anaerovoracaceae bacterium]|nr:MBL fold metallo-hydrolase [Bacillota bacterium]MDY2670727.1 MBL fold metallo-hydrolase [Anaerovoracaceae bacterium]
MALSVCSFASGSSGNCYLVRSSDTAILIDAGISTKRIHDSMGKIGVDRSSIDGVFITHEHSDHVKGLRVLTKKNPDWRIYTSEGTGEQIKDSIFDQSRLNCFEAGDMIEVGDMKVQSIKISHDAADPVCYSVSAEGSNLLIMTDTGFVPNEAASRMRGADIIVMEANHEVNMLKAGSYPYRLKMRILGDRGHLSNETAGETLAETMTQDPRYRKIYLAHLSRENNFPRLAFQTVKNILEENHFYPGRDFSLDVMRRDEISGMATV